jgi:pSer/pThr/pTyr-binding forkhead associated (FHA) protein
MWILQSSKPKVTFRIQPGAIKTIGRAPRADFILEAPLVSRLHCRVEASADGIDIIDLKSTNGTFVHDKRVPRARLAAGDKFRIGRVELTVSKSDNGDGPEDKKAGSA